MALEAIVNGHHGAREGLEVALPLGVNVLLALRLGIGWLNREDGRPVGKGAEGRVIKRLVDGRRVAGLRLRPRAQTLIIRVHVRLRQALRPGKAFAKAIPGRQFGKIFPDLGLRTTACRARNGRGNGVSASTVVERKA